MTEFFIIAASLSVGVLLFILPPLLRRGGGESAGQADGNVAIYRQQFAELDADLANGVLDAERYEQSKHELERRVLDAGADRKPPLATARRNWPLALLLAMSVPAAAAGLYLQLGSQQAFDLPYPQMEQAAAVEAPPAPADNVAELLPPMTERLVERLTKETPNDGNGWALLGRSYIALQRFDEASKAFARAVALLPEDASLLADYAGTLSMTSETRLQGKPTELIERALKVDPNNEKALYLSGVAAFDQKKYSAAIDHWEKMLALMPRDGGRKRAIIEANVAEAKGILNGDAPPTQEPAAPAQADANAAKPGATGGAGISGTVTLTPAMAAKASPGDTVFIYARAADGPAMPLAIINRKVKDLPLSFAMNDAMAMMPNMKLSSFDQVRVVARISKSGNAMPQSGDFQGMSPVVGNRTSNLNVVIDQVMP